MSEKKTRTIKTLQFGEISVEDDYIFTFEEGMLGFENLKDFVLITEEETVPFKWLVSVVSPEIGFPLLSPWHLDIEYDPGKEFNLEREVLFVIVTLGGKDKGISANMKAPIVLDTKTQKGKQVILPSDRYSTSYAVKGAESEAKS